MKSILLQEVECTENACAWEGVVDDCIPDVDGSGELGCPLCMAYVRQVTVSGLRNACAAMDCRPADELLKLWVDGDLVMIAPMDDCVTHARSLRDGRTYNLKNDAGLIQASYCDGVETWRQPVTVNAGEP